MTQPQAPADDPLVVVIDDDAAVRDSLDNLLRATGYAVRAFAGPQAFLDCAASDAAACLLLDVRLGNADGLDFQQALIDSEILIPVILMSGHGDIPMTVRAMRAGAVTFLPKPFAEEDLLAAVAEAVARNSARCEASAALASLRDRHASLTPRERDVLGLVSAGLMNKQIAGKLGVSEITVKIHRGNLMRKMEAQSLADLVRMAETLGVREDVSRYARD